MIIPPNERHAHVNDPHVLGLTSLVGGLRARGLNVPNVDPNDGGINASILFLLETPGPKAVGGFVSRDNPDPSARNFTQVCEQVGLERTKTAIWNVVPICISTADKSRNPSRSEIIAAVPDTQAFINQFVRLKAVIFCGGSAKIAMPYVDCHDAKKLATYHTGAQAYNRPLLRKHIVATFQKANALLAPPAGPQRMKNESIMDTQKKEKRAGRRTHWAAQIAVASELCKRGYEMAFTKGNATPLAELMVVSPKNKRNFLIDVKGLYRRNSWPIKKKDARDDFYYVLALVPDEGHNRLFILSQADVNQYIRDELDRLRRPDDYSMTGITWQQAAEHHENDWGVLPK
jgi:hypothetical protein